MSCDNIQAELEFYKKLVKAKDETIEALRGQIEAMKDAGVPARYPHYPDFVGPGYWPSPQQPYPPYDTYPHITCGVDPANGEDHSISLTKKELDAWKKEFTPSAEAIKQALREKA